MILSNAKNEVTLDYNWIECKHNGAIEPQKNPTNGEVRIIDHLLEII